MTPMHAKVDSVSRPNMNSQFRDSIGDEFHVTRVPHFKLLKSRIDPDLCRSIAQSSDPHGKWLEPVLALITDNLDHLSSVA